MLMVRKLEALLMRCRLGTEESRRAFAVLLKKHRDNERVFDALELLFCHSSSTMAHHLLSPCLRHITGCFECWKELHRHLGFWKPLEIKVSPPLEWHESGDEELRAKYEAQAASIESVRREMEGRAKLQWLYDRGEYVKLGSAEVAVACQYASERCHHFPGFPKSLVKYRPNINEQ